VEVRDVPTSKLSERQNSNRRRDREAQVIGRILSAVIAVALLLCVGYFLFGKGGDTTGAQARELVQAGARLVDVRTRAEFAAGHLPGAINIPVQELAERLPELRPKDTPVVLYCRSGRRSSSAARTLKSAGFAAVHDLGPMGRW
jgi:phage shock protein E